MSRIHSRACAIADLDAGDLLARVAIAAAPERVFQALTSSEITDWWVRPGVFDTREWTGDVRVGGRWCTSGVVRGEPYTLEGVFQVVDSPRRLVQTCESAGKPGLSTIAYTLEPIEDGTRITLRQSGFVTAEQCEAFALGWETSFDQLAEMLAPEFVAGW